MGGFHSRAPELLQGSTGPLRDKRRRLRGFGRRFSKFLTVGLANAAVDIGTLNLLLLLLPTREPWQFAVYNLVALVLAKVNSYVLNTRWTFEGRARHDARQSILFALQALVNIGVSNAIFWLAIRTMFDNTNLSSFAGGNLAKLLSTALASTLSYFILRHVVFSKKKRFQSRL